MVWLSKKESYSIGEIAGLCRVDVNQVMDWLRYKKLSFFETPGGHLRTTHRSLEDFMCQESIEKPDAWSGDWSKFKVLLVEDEMDLREILVELLKDETKIEISSEDNGYDGLLKVTSWKPDLLVLDFLMPGLTGFEICKRLRADEQFQDLPILAITSLSNNENRDAVYQAGVSDYLRKPFRGEELLKKVRMMLGLSLTTDSDA